MKHQCSFCELDAVYSLGWRDKNNVRFDNWSCDTHWVRAAMKQSQALNLDKTLDAVETMLFEVEVKDWNGIVASKGE